MVSAKHHTISFWKSQVFFSWEVPKCTISRTNYLEYLEKIFLFIWNISHKKQEYQQNEVEYMPTIPKELKGIIPPKRINKKKSRPRITESSRKKFKKEFLEEYKKEGISLAAASEKVGFSRQVLYRWTEADPEFAVKFEELRFIKKNKSKKEFDEKHKHDEEYKRQFLELYSDDTYSVAAALEEISPDIDKTDFDYWSKTDFEFKKQYKVLQQKLRPRIAKRNELNFAVTSAKVQEKQNRFLELFENEEHHFNLRNVCKVMDIKRSTALTWYKENPDFRNQIELIQSDKEDWAEDKLLVLAEKGNMPAIIFLNKILNQRPSEFRRHAYIEQPQKIEGRIEHVHKFDQDQIDAMVRGNQVDRGKYAEMLKIDDPSIIDAECVNTNE